MEEETNLEKEMPLTAAVRAFMESQGWDDDDLSINETRTASTLATSLIIEEQKYRLYIEVSEEDQRIFVFLYTPYNVPRSRLEIVSSLFNRLHYDELLFGRLSCKDGPEPRPIQFKCGFDLKGSTLSPEQVDTLVGLGVSTFRMHGELLAAGCLSKKSLEDLWLEHIAAEEEHSEWNGVKVPRLLN
ncbi:MAG: YbjN domain-containing protein [Actinobacteria bacterium]|nr:YbjN domain-containing protein [Actinomycetota bacterium]